MCSITIMRTHRNVFNTFDKDLEPVYASMAHKQAAKREALVCQRKQSLLYRFSLVLLLCSFAYLAFEFYSSFFTSDGRFDLSPITKKHTIYQVDPHHPWLNGQNGELMAKFNADELAEAQANAIAQALGQALSQAMIDEREQRNKAQALGSDSQMQYEQHQAEALAQAKERIEQQGLNSHQESQSLATNNNSNQSNSLAGNQGLSRNHGHGRSLDMGNSLNMDNGLGFGQEERRFAPVIEPQEMATLYKWFVPNKAKALSASLDYIELQALLELLKTFELTVPSYEDQSLHANYNLVHHSNDKVTLPLRDPFKRVAHQESLNPSHYSYSPQDHDDWQDILAMVAAVQKEIPTRLANAPWQKLELTPSQAK